MMTETEPRLLIKCSCAKDTWKISRAFRGVRTSSGCRQAWLSNCSSSGSNSRRQRPSSSVWLHYPCPSNIKVFLVCPRTEGRGPPDPPVCSRESGPLGPLKSVERALPPQIAKSSSSTPEQNAEALRISRLLTMMSVPVRCFQRLVIGLFILSSPVCSSWITSR